MVADPLKRHRWKTDGTIHMRRIEIISTGILILFVFILLAILILKDKALEKIDQIKTNYTELHDWKNNLKRIHKEWHNE